MTRREWENAYLKAMGDMEWNEEFPDEKRLARIEQTELFCISDIERATNRLRKLKILKQSYVAKVETNISEL